MNRIIKFRAFQQGMMSEVRNIGFDKKGVPNSATFIDLNVEQPILTQWFRPNDIKFDNTNPWIMQFTGLKDKNGKEIYEGDILQNDQEESIVSVRWDETGANWQFTEHNIFMDDGVGRGNWNLNMGFAKQCEVIGNIYENPELLK